MTHIIDRLHKNLKAFETLEIRQNGDILLCLHSDKTNKIYKKIPVGNLYKDLDETGITVPFRTKSWVSLNTVGFKHWRDNNVKKGKDLNAMFVKGMYETELNNPLNVVENGSENVMMLKYTYKKVGSYKAFYGPTGKLRWIEHKGKRYVVEYGKHDLNTQIMNPPKHKK